MQNPRLLLPGGERLVKTGPQQPPNLEIPFPIKQTEAQRHKHTPGGPSGDFCPPLQHGILAGEGQQRQPVFLRALTGQEWASHVWVCAAAFRGSRTQSSRKVCSEDLEAVNIKHLKERERGNKSGKEKGCDLYYILHARVHRTAWLKGSAWKRICSIRAGQGHFLG